MDTDLTVVRSGTVFVVGTGIGGLDGAAVGRVGPVHKRTDSHLAVWQDRRTPDCGDNHMIFIGGVGILLIGVGIIHQLWVPRGVNSTNLGGMSEQWLAEHRASHSP